MADQVLRWEGDIPGRKEQCRCAAGGRGSHLGVLLLAQSQEAPDITLHLGQLWQIGERHYEQGRQVRGQGQREHRQQKMCYRMEGTAELRDREGRMRMAARLDSLLLQSSVLLHDLRLKLVVRRLDLCELLHSQRKAGDQLGHPRNGYAGSRALWRFVLQAWAALLPHRSSKQAEIHRQKLPWPRAAGVCIEC